MFVTLALNKPEWVGAVCYICFIKQHFSLGFLWPYVYITTHCCLTVV